MKSDLDCPCCARSIASGPLVSGSFRYRSAGEDKEWVYSLFKCDACGTGRLYPLPEPAALAQLYGSDYEAYSPNAEQIARSRGQRLKMAVARVAASARRLDDRPSLRAALAGAVRLLENAGGRSVPLTASFPLSLPRDAAILDFGCGSGWWLRAMRAQGYSALWAYDVDQPCLDELAALGIRRCPRPEDLPARTFDCIRMEHVLEHLVDPEASLRMLGERLRAEGRIALTVPNFGSGSAERAGPAWPALRLPHHLTHFTVDGVRRLARRAGLEVVEIDLLPITEMAPEPWSDHRLVRQIQKLDYHRRARAAHEGEYVAALLKAG